MRGIHPLKIFKMGGYSGGGVNASHIGGLRPSNQRLDTIKM